MKNLFIVCLLLLPFITKAQEYENYYKDTTIAFAFIQDCGTTPVIPHYITKHIVPHSEAIVSVIYRGEAIVDNKNYKCVVIYRVMITVPTH